MLENRGNPECLSECLNSALPAWQGKKGGLSEDSRENFYTGAKLTASISVVLFPNLLYPVHQLFFSFMGMEEKGIVV